MFIKCSCTHCREHLEFESANAGQTIPCPHCGKETQLVMPLGHRLKSWRWMIALGLVNLVSVTVAITAGLKVFAVERLVEQQKITLVELIAAGHKTHSEIIEGILETEQKQADVNIKSYNSLEERMTKQKSLSDAQSEAIKGILVVMQLQMDANDQTTAPQAKRSSPPSNSSIQGHFEILSCTYKITPTSYKHHIAFLLKARNTSATMERKTYFDIEFYDSQGFVVETHFADTSFGPYETKTISGDAYTDATAVRRIVGARAKLR